MEKPIVFSESFDNPQSPVYKKITTRLEEGIEGCYPHTELKNAFVSAEVNDIINPVLMNASYDTGLLFNTTVHFRKGMVRVPSDAYYQLVKYITEENNDEVGDSDLYLNPQQPDPFKPCFKNDCDPHGKCIETSKYTYKCECGVGYRDINPQSPGKKCLPVHGFNECERKEDNECSENARCIDLEHLYKCECLPSYYDNSAPGEVPGSLCVLDYCSDVNFCPTNTTCKNMEQQAECKCDPGFMDIRKSEKRTALGMGDDTLCMHVRDVDECALGLNNCSGVAHCIDKAVGYTCKCPDGYIDGNPDEPGRVCGALLCDLCNAHGDCVHNTATNNITCICTDGWSGAQCQNCTLQRLIGLLILLALLFLLLTLCCLLYFCTKCHCFKGRRFGGGAGTGAFGYRRGGAWPWSTLEGSSSSESGAEFSAMSAAGNEYYPDIGIPRAKLKSGAAGGAVTTSNNMESQMLEVSKLDKYLDENMVRIPRAHLVDVHGDMSFDSMSEASSEYTIKEEIERKVTTDVTTKEIKTTTTTDESGNTVITTSEAVHHPGGTTTVHGSSGMTSGAAGYSMQNNDSSSSSYSGAAYQSAQQASSFSAAAASSEMSSAQNMGGYASIRHTGERERGDSVEEFSIGRARGVNAHTSSLTANREVEEYCSEEEDVEHSVGDKRTFVSKNHSYEPFYGGESEKFRTEVVTQKTSTQVTKK
uniref:EGF-like domain-containing protein n=1 Tax=Caenorhabditis japonica TaxID=281687 RepID=A0A8R1EUP2_CAEJA